jgi:hypothetical protein
MIVAVDAIYTSPFVAHLLPTLKEKIEEDSPQAVRSAKLWKRGERLSVSPPGRMNQ